MTRLLDLGALSLGFRVTRKWIGVNVVSEWDQPVQGPFSDLDFRILVRKLKIWILHIGPIPCPGTDHLASFG